YAGAAFMGSTGRELGLGKALRVRMPPREDTDEPLESELIAVRPEPGDSPHAGARDPGSAPERLARIGVRQVYLDARERDCGERVENRDRRMRVCAWVDDKPVDPAPRSLTDPVDDGPLVIRLPDVDLDSQRKRALLEASVDLGERLAAVDIRLAHPQELQVRAGDAADPDR